MSGGCHGLRLNCHACMRSEMQSTCFRQVLRFRSVCYKSISQAFSLLFFPLKYIVRIFSFGCKTFTNEGNRRVCGMQSIYFCYLVFGKMVFLNKTQARSKHTLHVPIPNGLFLSKVNRRLYNFFLLFSLKTSARDDPYISTKLQTPPDFVW